MKSVVIIGFGNVGQAFTKAIAGTDNFEVVQIFCRNGKLKTSSFPCPVTFDMKELLPADLYLICVSDDAIGEVSNDLPFRNRLVVHCSGSIPMTALSAAQRRGVFYPLQSFSPDKAVEWSEVPFCLEAEKEDDIELLTALARELSDRVYSLSSEQRKRLHLAAVLVNNFVNHLYYLGESYCREHDIPFDILHPLISETALKIQNIPPYEAQTGPARRNDQKTLNSQLLQLKGSSLEEIYKTLTTSIIATYEREKL
ncbi:Rossmann-like and DUF2520 domain-containing protein [Robertkochia flava]|uniref:Rossmann-like and DUF2520 domain-containing protein n=1 Tax=Robertkochia flava TaxID=3447986 RepID=UPI001CCB44FE|nr:DUF2520 domain-containing protein [Robertkochia marina]